MKIKVTQDHIDRGIRKSCTNCAVHLAICDAFSDLKDIQEAFTSLFYSNIITNKKRISLELPKVANDFILAFDTGKEVKPFEFEIIHKKEYDITTNN